MRNLKSKIKKIEKKIKPDREIFMFTAGGPDREEKFERQKVEYLQNGGNPDANFIMIITHY